MSFLTCNKIYLRLSFAFVFPMTKSISNVYQMYTKCISNVFNDTFNLL
jgi:hypothetical protein